MNAQMDLHLDRVLVEYTRRAVRDRDAGFRWSWDDEVRAWSGICRQCEAVGGSLVVGDDDFEYCVACAGAWGFNPEHWDAEDVTPRQVRGMEYRSGVLSTLEERDNWSWTRKSPKRWSLGRYWKRNGGQKPRKRWSR